jgi:hypothetical protein
MLSALRCIGRRGINGSLKRTACTSALQTKKIQTQSREYVQHKYASKHSLKTDLQPNIATQIKKSQFNSNLISLRANWISNDAKYL